MELRLATEQDIGKQVFFCHGCKIKIEAKLLAIVEGYYVVKQLTAWKPTVSNHKWYVEEKEYRDPKGSDLDNGPKKCQFKRSHDTEWSDGELIGIILESGYYIEEKNGWKVWINHCRVEC